MTIEEIKKITNEEVEKQYQDLINEINSNILDKAQKGECSMTLLLCAETNIMGSYFNRIGYDVEWMGDKIIIRW